MVFLGCGSAVLCSAVLAQVQYESFQRATAAREPKMFVQVPCAIGGHAGMMDACGLIGHKATWLGMVDAVEAYLRKAFDL